MAQSEDKIGGQKVAIWVINLARNAGRLANMARQLKAMGLVWQRFDAIDFATGAHLTHGGDVEPNDPSHWMSAAEWACTLSHRVVWQEFLASDAKEALILEDDLELFPPFAELAKVGLGATDCPLPVKVEWHKNGNKPVLLGKVLSEYPTNFGEIRSLHSNYFGSASYYLTRAAAQRLVARTRRLRAPTDVILFNPLFWPLHQLVGAGILMTPMAVQDRETFASDLQSSRRARGWKIPKQWADDFIESSKITVAIMLWKTRWYRFDLSSWMLTKN